MADMSVSALKSMRTLKGAGKVPTSIASNPTTSKPGDSRLPSLDSDRMRTASESSEDRPMMSKRVRREVPSSQQPLASQVGSFVDTWRVGKLSADVQNLKATLNEIRQESDALHQRDKERERSVQIAQKRDAEREKHAASTEQRLVALGQFLESLNPHLEVLQKRDASREKYIDWLVQRDAAREKDIEALRQRIATLEARPHVTQERIEGLESDFGNIRMQLRIQELGIENLRLRQQGSKPRGA